MFEPINKLIRQNQISNPSLLLSPEVCFMVESAILGLIPESKNKIRVISFNNSRIKLSSDNAILLHKIKMQEEEIIKRVLKKIKIKPFRFIYLPKESS